MLVNKFSMIPKCEITLMYTVLLYHMDRVSTKFNISLNSEQSTKHRLMELSRVRVHVSKVITMRSFNGSDNSKWDLSSVNTKYVSVWQS